MNNWFTVKVKYTKTLDDGKLQRVSESYLLGATNFTDAEARAHEEIGSMVRGEFDVVSITRTELHDIFNTDSSDTWFKCKVNYLEVVDEKEKKTSQTFLVGGDTVKEADDNLKSGLSGLMVDFEVVSIVKSPIVDIFPVVSAEVKTQIEI